MTSASSSATRTRTPAARLAELARLLGAADPAPVLGELLDEGVPHAGNALLPGGAPLELSFAERSPSSLRVEIEPYGPDISGPERLARATRAVRALAGEAFGDEVAGRLDEHLSTWRDGGGQPVFGAFAGAVFDASGLVELKLYREVVAATALPASLAASAREVAAFLPGVRPHFASLAATHDGIAERLYLVCEEGLRTLDLEPLMREAGLAHRLPALADTVAAVTAGRLYLPERGSLVAVRRSGEGTELKIELLGDALPASSGRVLEGVRRALAERPLSLDAFNRFVAAVEMVFQAPAQPAVLSVHCAPATGCALNVYLRT